MSSPLRGQLGTAFARRGAVYLIHQVDFGDGPMAKFCVLMESFREGADTLVVVFTTSRLEFSHRRSCVVIEDGTIDGLSGDTLLDCNNAHEIDANKITRLQGVKYLDKLSDEVMEKIDEALEHATRVDEPLFLRMLG